MDIPALQENGELPLGEHPATVDDIEAVFGSSTGRRRLLMRGLRAAIANFELSGVRTLWLNGSFTTDKNEPNDIDGCWEYTRKAAFHFLSFSRLIEKANRKALLLSG